MDAATADATPRGQLYHSGGLFVKGVFHGACGRGGLPVFWGGGWGVGVLRLYARAAVPGGPFPAAADATPRPLPWMGKGGGMGRSPRSPARCAEAAPWPPRGEAIRGG